MFGFSGTVLCLLNGGLVESTSQVLLQIFGMGILRAVIVPIILSFHKIVKDAFVERKQKEEKEKTN